MFVPTKQQNCGDLKIDFIDVLHCSCFNSMTKFHLFHSGGRSKSIPWRGGVLGRKLGNHSNMLIN